VQEIYGLLLGSKSCKVIDFSSGKQRKPFTLASFFYWTLRVIRRALPKSQGLQPQELPFFSVVNLGDSRSKYTGNLPEKQPKSREKTWSKISV
jgi:hypothetical protein